MELRAFIEITRPHNCALAGIVGVLGSVVAAGGGVPGLKTALLVFLVVFLGCAGGNTINDYFDYEIDKINRPERPPLPRGGPLAGKRPSGTRSLSSRWVSSSRGS